MVRTPEISVVQENGNIRVSWIYPEPVWPDEEGYIYNESTHEDMWVVGYDDVGSYNSFTKQADHLRIRAGDWEYESEMAAVTDEMVDLTGIDLIEIDWASHDENDGLSALIASTNKDGDATIYDARFIRNYAFVRRIDTLDVSGLTGNHYIRIHAVQNIKDSYTVYAYKVRLIGGS